MTLRCCCQRYRVSINHKLKNKNRIRGNQEINCLHSLDEYLKVVVKRRQKTPAFLDLTTAWENISTKVIQESTPECRCTSPHTGANITVNITVKKPTFPAFYFIILFFFPFLNSWTRARSNYSNSMVTSGKQ